MNDIYAMNLVKREKDSPSCNTFGNGKAKCRCCGSGDGEFVVTSCWKWTGLVVCKAAQTNIVMSRLCLAQVVGFFLVRATRSKYIQRIVLVMMLDVSRRIVNVFSESLVKDRCGSTTLVTEAAACADVVIQQDVFVLSVKCFKFILQAQLDLKHAGAI